MTMTGLDIEATYRDLIERLDPIERAKLAELLYHAVDDDNLTPTEVALRAAGRRLGDLELNMAIRRMISQATLDAQRAIAAEARSGQSAAQVDVLITQRDGAIAQARTLQHALTTALTERDNARAAHTKAMGEVKRLQIESATLKAKLATPPPAPAPVTPPKAKVAPPEAFASIVPPKPSAEEAALLEQRAAIIAELKGLDAIPKFKRTPEQHTRNIELQETLAAMAPKVRAFKMVRHAKLMALQAEVLAEEAVKGAGL